MTYNPDIESLFWAAFMAWLDGSCDEDQNDISADENEMFERMMNGEKPTIFIQNDVITVEFN